MAEGQILEQPQDAPAGPVEEQEDAPQEVPSVFSVVNRYLVGAVEVSPPVEDGSRIIRLQSANGSVLIEANLSEQLSTFLGDKLTAVEIIAEGDEQPPETDDARSKE